MRFIVSRASEGAMSNKLPCRRAVRGPEAKAWPGEYQWFIEVDTPEDLLTLLNETGGALGLFSPEEDEAYPVIEIFDEDQTEE